MNVQSKVMNARLSLQFEADIDRRRVGYAATRFAVKPEIVATVELNGSDLLYNPDWANTASESEIATAIFDLIKSNIPPEVAEAVERIMTGQ